VAKTSFILSTAIGGGGAGGKGGKKAGPKRTNPLWDVKKIEKGQCLSQTIYFNVKSIDGGRITVVN
jgi:hypothetical protein